MSSESELIGRNVERIRRERGLSMGELARRSLLSKQTLSVLESGLGNPTVDTVSAVAATLGVTTRRLLTERGSPVYVQRGLGAAWTVVGDQGVRELGQVTGSGNVQSLLVRLNVAVHSPGPLPALDSGALHHLYVVQGRLRCGPTSEPVEADEGDFVRFPADAEHVMVALTDLCLAHLVTTTPQRTQFGLSQGGDMVFHD